MVGILSLYPSEQPLAHLVDVHLASFISTDADVLAFSSSLVYNVCDCLFETWMDVCAVPRSAEGHSIW